MAEIFIRYVDPDGYSVHTPWDDEQPLPEGAEIIPRMPDPINPGEEWDGTQFSVPAEIEQKVIEARLGKEHTRELWIIRYLEALMVSTLDAANIPVTKGFLFEEAKQRNITIKQRANQVLLKARNRLEDELMRQSLGGVDPDA
jgi:hypothetical protein